MRSPRALALVSAAAFVCAMPALAAVERIEIIERVPFAPGVTFGESGAYEKIRGVAHYALDPKAIATYPPADITLERIGDLVKYDLAALLGKK